MNLNTNENVSTGKLKVGLIQKKNQTHEEKMYIYIYVCVKQTKTNEKKDQR